MVAGDVAGGVARRGPAGWLNPQVLPSPWQVLQRWWVYALPPDPYDPSQSRLTWLLSGELVHDAWGSLGRVLAGFAIGAVLALPLGLLMGASQRVYEWFNPLLQVLRPIPPIAWIPLSILWFGLGNPPAIFLIALGAFFPGVDEYDCGCAQCRQHLYPRRAQPGRQSTRAVYPGDVARRDAVYPGGARIGMGTAFIVVIVSEMIAVNNGLGFRILEAREYFWSDKIIAGMLSIGLLGLAIDMVMAALNNHLLRWHRGQENDA